MRHVRGSKIFASALCALALTAAAFVPLTPARSAHAKGNPRGSEWTVLAPVSYKNLTIFPVRGADLAGSEAYITLDEGTKAGTVVITEKGAQQASTRRTQGRRPLYASNGTPVQQEVSYNSGASVNELALVNRSGK